MRAAPAALALALYWAAAAAGLAAAAPVNSGQELLTALAGLSGGANATVELQQAVALSPSEAAAYQLPFLVSSNQILALRGEGLQNLDCGEIPLLLDVNSGGTLVLENLNISGIADQDAPVPGSNTTIQLLSVWPTITGESGAAIDMRNVNLTLHPSARCSVQNVGGLAQQLAVSAAQGSTISAEGLSFYLTNFSLPLPIVDANGSSGGDILFYANATNLTCQPLPAPASSGSGGLSGCAIAGTAVGAAAAAAALAGAAWWLLRRQRQGGGAAAQGHLDDEGGKQAWELAAEGGKEAAAEGGAGAALPASQAPPGHGSGSGPGSTPISVGGGQNGSADLGLGSPGALQQHGGLLKSRVGAIEGLQLGGILGRGAYGHVHRGRWKGTQVAVKIVPIHVGPGERVDLEHEPLLSLSLSHPNVLAAYKMCVVRLQSADEEEGNAAEGDAEDCVSGAAPAAAAAAGERQEGEGPDGRGSADQGPSTGSGGGDRVRSTFPARSGSTAASALGSGGAAPARRLVPSLTNKSSLVEVVPAQAVLEPGLYETWLVTELADGGSLADAIAMGRFKSDMQAILLCLLDIARGLEYLHSSNILHGDLKPQNVLLRSARADRRGFVCKLCDFGLSRLLSDHQTHVQTRHFGTVSHAAPELLREGRLTRSSDIFALGIVAWELLSGQAAFAGVPSFQVMTLVSQQDFRLPVPEHCPRRLAALMQRCWDDVPQARPDAAAVVEELIQIGGSLQRTAGT
ncbi:hypothetical protein ABPG75_001277 [Micractinium tetrahymenae]